MHRGGEIVPLWARDSYCDAGRKNTNALIALSERNAARMKTMPGSTAQSAPAHLRSRSTSALLGPRVYNTGIGLQHLCGRCGTKVCGIVLSQLYIAMNVFVAMRWEGYSSVSQT